MNYLYQLQNNQQFLNSLTPDEREIVRRGVDVNLRPKLSTDEWVTWTRILDRFRQQFVRRVQITTGRMR